jgi:hypothetical protein
MSDGIETPPGADPYLVAEITHGLPAEERAVVTPDDVPGWFHRTDQDLFTWILGNRLAGLAPGGDLVELGTFLGRSAIHMGRFLREGEKLIVCDLFGLPVDEPVMSRSARAFYSTPTREQFERNYRLFRPEPPVVVQAPTSAILQHVAPRSCRFVHIDASHEYTQVRADLLAAGELLVRGGVVAVDDYRSEHTPGTAAAVWEALVRDGLHPVCISPDKFYGTWEPAEELRKDLVRVLAHEVAYTVAVHEVMGHRIPRAVRIR